MHKNYKQDEFAIRNVIEQSIFSVEATTDTKLIIYYKKIKLPITASAIITPTKNIILTRLTFAFPVKNGVRDKNQTRNNYVERKTTTLSQRLTNHFSGQNAIWNQLNQHPWWGNIPVDNTKIIQRSNSKNRPKIRKALMINAKKTHPTICTLSERVRMRWLIPSPGRRLRLPLKKEVSWVWNKTASDSEICKCGVPFHCHYFQVYSDL